jgi:hypothetical protein|tara:strand:+ start:2642 stop:3070 length:429 start_codon:yes stop_codon:yes gene_type:complete
MNKSDILLNSINTFYILPENRTILKELLNKTGGISLRNLEWFITNYSKKNNLTYKTRDGKLFSVHCAYKSSLDGYSKKLFDPFCRSNKMQYIVPGTSDKISTTVAQLNFIRWCIKNSIVDYIRNHHSDLFNKSGILQKVTPV